MSIISPRKSLNKAYLKVKHTRTEVDGFKANLITLLEQINHAETEEFNKNVLADFLKNTFYSPNYFINTKGRNDLVIHNGKTASDSVGVIIEAKRANNVSEMLKKDNINAKALQELVLYYLRERITNKNLEVRNLIVTNVNEWYVFDANVFEKCFAKNKKLVQQFIDFENGKLSGITTDFFYKEIAQPFIQQVIDDIEFTYFVISEINSALRNSDNGDDTKLIPFLKLLSPEHLLKVTFANDSNSLNRGFYTELLHIIGLEEIKDGSKRIIARKKEGERFSGTLIENSIIQISSLFRLGNLKNKRAYGETEDEQLFNVAIELAITWINRILFLKLLEAQLISYNKNNTDYAFLNVDKIKHFNDLNTLFFQVLAVDPSKRDSDVKLKYSKVPYLNSSLFEPALIEREVLFVSNLSDDKKIPILSLTVLKDANGSKLKGELNAIEYLFKFLDSYDFASDISADIKEDNKTLISASVLGLIFEKINGYKDGSFFTPSLVTMYMSKEALKNSVVNKVNEISGLKLKSLSDIYNSDIDSDKLNEIINSIKVCDPAVGSGHFLVSLLNEFLSIKAELGLLKDKNGKRLKGYTFELENDELIVADEDGEIFEYKPTNSESQRIQETIFNEKKQIIERCLFGVDINPNSVKICRLRLWIELLKNAYYKENGELETLPNIDINIKCGNSLISRFDLKTDLKDALKKSKLTIPQYKSAVSSYREAKSKEEKWEMDNLINEVKSGFQTEILYHDPKVKKLENLKVEVKMLELPQTMFEETDIEKKERELKRNKAIVNAEELENKIAEIRNNKIYENAFEWRFEFPEVLNDDGDFVGFDVVIGNPPYLIVFDEKEKAYLESNIEPFKRNNDLYVAFFIKAFELLKDNGNFSFITSNTFIKGSYFIKLREFLVENVQLTEIVDFGTKLIFTDADVFCAITSFEKMKSLNDWTLKSDIQNVIGTINHTSTDFILKNSLISKLDTFDKVETYFDVKDVGFNYWTEGRGKVRGNSIGSRVFYKGDKLDNNDVGYIKGSDISKFKIGFSNNYLKHNWKSFLTEDDTFRFSEDYFNRTEKIVYRQTSDSIIAALDTDKKCNDKTVHIVVCKNQYQIPLKYLLAILNSKLLNYYFRWHKQEEGKAFAQVKTVDIKALPFIYNDRKDLINLVDIAINEGYTTEIANKIDAIVYEIFELNNSDIDLIEQAS